MRRYFRLLILFVVATGVGLAAQQAQITVPARFIERWVESSGGITYRVMQDSRPNSGNQCFLVVLGSQTAIAEASISAMALPPGACQ